MSTFLQLYQQIEKQLLQSNEKIGVCNTYIQELKLKNSQLEQELEETRRELQECKQKNNSSTINASAIEDMTEIKKEINDLVREIDNCISCIKGK